MSEQLEFSSPELKEWFANVTDSQKDILLGLRGMILSLDGQITEALKWSRPCYSNERGLFCYLQTNKNYATLGFHKGTSLQDPARLLEGTGKDMRHVKVKSLEGNEADLRALIEEAFRL